ncbi:MAG: flagellar type III secretion system protein FlhB [Betaproteobacteria bacterium]|nr:flagellar type III secretion system protein FlhB [Betaproteobacteria bacterium]
MADENDFERTEPASPRRLEQAREEGQVARSQELNTFALLATVGASIWVLGGQLLSGLTGLMRSGLTLSAEDGFRAEQMARMLGRHGSAGFMTIAPVLAAAFLAALVAPLLLNGWLFTLKPLQPNFSRLNPFSGFGRIFSAHGLVELAKAISKVLVVGGVATMVIWNSLDAVLSLSQETTASATRHAARLVGWTLILMVGGMVLIVAIDVPYQLWNHYRKLRMSRAELKREAKESEGDPQIKARIRSLQREAARKRMMAEVPKADVVITNPTHYSVALSYKENSMRAPRIVAKGQDLTAMRIRELAQEHRIPIVEAPPLARALYRHTDLGDEIPETLYTAVAEVLAYVFQLRRFNLEGGRAPQLPGEIVVPADLDPQQGKS